MNILSSDGEETLSYTRRERTEISTNTPHSDHETSDTSGGEEPGTSLSGQVVHERQSSHPAQDEEIPIQSSKNLIADLISKKRNQLLKKSKRKDESESSDHVIINQILESARRTLRTDSDTSCDSSSSSSLLSMSSIVNRNDNTESHSHTDEQDLPSTSNAARNNEVLNKKRMKRKLKILLDSDSSQSGTELENMKEDLSNERKDKIQFKKHFKGKKNFRRKSSSSESDH